MYVYLYEDFSISAYEIIQKISYFSTIKRTGWGVATWKGKPTPSSRISFCCVDCPVSGWRDCQFHIDFSFLNEMFSKSNWHIDDLLFSLYWFELTKKREKSLIKAAASYVQSHHAKKWNIVEECKKWLMRRGQLLIDSKKTTTINGMKLQAVGKTRDFVFGK